MICNYSGIPCMKCHCEHFAFALHRLREALLCSIKTLKDNAIPTMLLYKSEIRIAGLRPSFSSLKTLYNFNPAELDKALYSRSAYSA